MGGRHATKGPAPNALSPAIKVLDKRLRKYRAELRRLGFDPDIYKKLLPFVWWTSGEAVVEPHPAVAEQLERTLGPRLPDLEEQITQPPPSALRAEIRRQLQKGVPPDFAPAMAEVTLIQGAMRKQRRDPDLERETPGWEAATAAAVAEAAMNAGTPQALQNADEYFARLDTARASAHLQAALHRKLRPAEEARRKGGSAPKRRPMIWRQVLLLVKKNPSISDTEVWNSFAQAEPGSDLRLIYRDGEKLVEVDDRTGLERTIRRRTLERYVTDARKKLASRSN